MKIGSLTQRLKSLNIAQQLIWGFGIIGFFILLNTIVTVGIHVYSRTLQAQETEEYVPVRENLNDMMNKLTESRRLAVNWVYVERQPNTPDKVRLANIVNTDFNAVLEQVKEKTSTWEPEFRDTLGLLEEKVSGFFDMERTVMNNLSTFDSYDDSILQMESEMLVQSDGDIEVAERELKVIMASLSSVCDAKCDDIKERIETMNTMQLIFVILLSILVGASAVVVGRGLYNSIVAPLKKGVSFAEAIGKGDLTATIDFTSRDEIGQLCEALRAMVNNLRNIVMTIDKNSNKLVESGVSLNASSQKLSKGASEQAASAEEVSTAIEEMVANIDQNTENAIATEKLTSSTVENVNLSSQYSGEAAQAMKTISEKISIISDIAFQTNILALNAAVEAVRAGEQGRGFSVVAAEVRKLAERSKQAASEIVTLVNQGLRVTQMAGEKAKSLVPDIEKTTVLIKEISAASIEQKTGAEQINMAMQNLNVITQENASSSDELTNSSVVLSNLAAELKQAVDYFKLSESDTSNPELAGLPKEEKAQPAPAEEHKVEEHKEETHRQESQPSPGGAKIDLGNISSKEFDLDNYEKF